jgi:hypothetical protein
VAQLACQRAIDRRRTEAVADRLQLGRHHMLIGFGDFPRPWAPSSTREPIDGTGTIARRRITPASTLVYSALRTACGATAFTGPTRWVWCSARW